MPGPNLTSQRWGHCATLLGGNVVLTGGVDFLASGIYLNLVEIYSLEVMYFSNRIKFKIFAPFLANTFVTRPLNKRNHVNKKN